jgi:hypothetical protein
MGAVWKQVWKAAVVPAVFLSSSTLGQTSGAWVDPPADLSALSAQPTERTPSVEGSSRAVVSSAPTTAAPVSEAEPRSSLSAVHPNSKARTKGFSFQPMGQQGQSASSQAVPRQRNAQSASGPAGTPTSTSDMTTQPSLVRGRSRSREEAAQNLAVNYLKHWSGSNHQALQTTPEFYGSRVLFHGKRMHFGELLAEKRRFAQRWPDRDYRYRPETLNVRCSPGTNTCTVRSAFNFEAVNSKLDERSRGVGMHELVVSFAGERPVIIVETSRVLSRGNRQ